MAMRKLFALPAVLIVFGACGPSFQTIYENDARFEHCYALEEASLSSMQQRSDCWRDWMLRYTYGQTRDRVEYASARYRALSRAPQAPTDEAMMEAAPGEGRGVTFAAPAPTSAFAPPPKTLGEMGDGGPPASGVLPGYTDAGVPGAAAAETGSTTASVPKPPGSDCAAKCDTAWGECKVKCTGRACDSCTPLYRSIGWTSWMRYEHSPWHPRRMLCL